MDVWEDYLQFLDGREYSIRALTRDLIPTEITDHTESTGIERLNYELWSFQQKILDDMGKSTLILGLPTGLGKTYLAGAYLKRESMGKKTRVLFLVPTVPLGVQQTIFARNMLNVEKSFLVTGGINPKKRKELKVWNNAFIVTTPQTFANDFLKTHAAALNEAKRSDYPTHTLAKALPNSKFPFDIVVADECQRYIGETDGYSVLLAATAFGSKIVALSATPQLHAPERLKELKLIFEKIKVFSIEDPEIKEHVPERLVTMVRVKTPEPLMKVYKSLGTLINSIEFRIKQLFGTKHRYSYCREHFLCKKRLALKMLKHRLVEDGASSVVSYNTWRFPELKKKSGEKGESIHLLYKKALDHTFNHKISTALTLLRHRSYKKLIVYMESVMAAKQMAGLLHKKLGMERVAVLVGKESMSMDQQASALFQFKERADILICTSIGEEGLDIPSANAEIWLDPPSNPKKWIQRFGRILRQPGDKKTATVYALISMRTHEKHKFLAVKKQTEKIYRFTQELSIVSMSHVSRGQRTLLEY